MLDSSERHHYSSHRLPNVSYREPFYYFVTLCADYRRPLFGNISGGQMQLGPIGRIVEDEWRRSSMLRKELILDSFVVMPDHMHALVGLWGDDADQSAHCRAALQTDKLLREAHDRASLSGEDADQSAHCCAAPQTDPLARTSRERAPRSLSSFIAQFKAYSTKRINEQRNAPGARVWQPGYYDHIVRIAEDLDSIRNYIQANPLRWQARQDGLP